MGDITAIIYNRDFTGTETPSLTITVDRYSRAAIGGCKSATITVEGPDRDVFDCIRWLRRAVAIDHARLGRAWWGYVSDVDVQLRNKTVSASLDWMANKIKVIYSDDSERAETAWASDADSIATYGTKELVQSINETTATGAEAERDRALAMLKTPQPRLSLSGTGGRAKAVLKCRGWYSTLGWQRYPNTIGEESYTDDASLYWQAFGWLEASSPNYITYVAQSFQLSDAQGWNAETLEVCVSKVGTPGNLIMRLCSDSGGSPGAVIDTAAAVSVDDISEYQSFGWVKAELTTKVALSPGVTYWLRVEQSGANSTANHYRLRGNGTLGYTSGLGKMYLNGAWAGLGGNNQDFLFRVRGSWNNTTSIEYILDTAGPQFITGVTVTGTGGATGNPERNGDTTLLAELETLLKQGTNDDRRFLARVNPDRTMDIYPEPLRMAPAYLIGYDNELLTTEESPLDWALCPAGVWVRARGIPPDGDILNSYEDVSVQFIEECEWQASSPQKPALTIRGTPSPFSTD